jgi:predicted dehydrogenase
MKALVVGCGSIGKRHMRLLQSLSVDVVGVDPRADRRQEVAATLGATTFPDCATALRDDYDIALICTPTRLHVDDALAAVRAAAHVFIEKPISDTLKGLDELIEAADESRRLILVGCNFRFDRGLQKVKALVTSGAIGRILGSRVVFGHYLPAWHPWEDYRSGYSARADLGGGVILDAVHEIDYIRWLVGEVTSVFCSAGKVSDLQLDVEDYADLVLEFENGTSGTVHLDYIQRAYQRSLEIYGSEGTVRWSFQDREVSLFAARTMAWQSFDWKQDPTYTVDEMYVHELRHLLACAAGDESPQLDGRGGKRVLEIALAAKTSARTRQRVALNG